MSSVTDTISALPELLSPLKRAAHRYAQYPSRVSNDGLLLVGQRPWVAPKNYILTVFPGLTDSEVAQYEERFEIEVPSSYQDVLGHIGGAFCFGMSLFGIPRSMLSEPRLLDRSVIQCHNLATAVNLWSHEYRVPTEFFHFGSRHFSYTENIGYFLNGSGHVFSARKTGETIAVWTDISEFLRDELAASEVLENELQPPQWDG